jgi:hypothetical protein
MKNMEDNKTKEIEVGSGNIFADLGLDDADELYTRSALGIQVMKNYQGEEIRPEGSRKTSRA